MPNRVTDVDSYVESLLNWERSGCVVDLHFPFGKLSLDRYNRVVDREFINNNNLR